MDSALLTRAARVLEDRISMPPAVHVVLGSGLAGLVASVEDSLEVSFAELPGFPASTVEGHTGTFVFGRISGVPVVVQSGRYHYYEGWPDEVVVGPVRLAQAIGARVLLVTNAAGGVRHDLTPGSLMLIDDHLNFQFKGPLMGPVRPEEARFPDMSSPYDRSFAQGAEAAALELGIPLSRGVYGAVLGPSYETPAEVRALRRMGVDAVGMSTVPEVICARGLGSRVLGFSMISNRAAGLADETLDHAHVMAVGRRAGVLLERLVHRVLPALADRP
ncbi:MAG: purine-nucleoside phosphorylase [Gemmatimonadetes bacterium]|nr:purine-nucleoside phosphorylase [Gemmatimonadota bacterium]